MQTDQLSKIAQKMRAANEKDIEKAQRKVQGAVQSGFHSVKKYFPGLITFYIDYKRYPDAIELANRYLRLSGLNHRVKDTRGLKKLFNCRPGIFKLPMFCGSVDDWEKAVMRLKEIRRKNIQKVVACFLSIVFGIFLFSAYTHSQYSSFDVKKNDTANLYGNIGVLEGSLPFWGKSILLEEYYGLYFKQLVTGPQYLDMYDYNLFKKSISDNEKLVEKIQSWKLSDETRDRFLNTIAKVNFGLQGRILKQEKDYQQASMFFMKALNENDVVEDIFGNDFINSQIALLNAEINMPLEEIKKFMKSELKEGNFNTYMAYGDLFKMLAPPNATAPEFIEYYGEAESNYRKAVSIEPGNVWVHIRLGHLLRDKFTLTGNESFYKMAEIEYLSAKELSAKQGLLPLGALISLGHLHKDRYYRTGDKQELQEGIGNYESALELDPNNIVAFYNLGGIYLREKEADAAISYFERILAINDKFVDSNFRAGDAYYLKFKETYNSTYLEKAKFFFRQQLEQDKQYGVTDFLERGGIQGYGQVIEQYTLMIKVLKNDQKNAPLISRARHILIEAYLRRNEQKDIKAAFEEFQRIKDTLSAKDAESILSRIQARNLVAQLDN
ncbi:hypothetical protein HYV84_07525 [Candidatus Woesearchaeota archaeon]|nr:hypothetical protein [Candidatus Woesearchaeota archaeon]